MNPNADQLIDFTGVFIKIKLNLMIFGETNINLLIEIVKLYH